jgi:hypothetical protein
VRQHRALQAIAGGRQTLEREGAVATGASRGDHVTAARGDQLELEAGATVGSAHHPAQARRPLHGQLERLPRVLERHRNAQRNQALPLRLDPDRGLDGDAGKREPSQRIGAHLAMAVGIRERDRDARERRPHPRAHPAAHVERRME